MDAILMFYHGTVYGDNYFDNSVSKACIFQDLMHWRFHLSVILSCQTSYLTRRIIDSVNHAWPIFLENILSDTSRHKHVNRFLVLVMCTSHIMCDTFLSASKELKKWFSRQPLLMHSAYGAFQGIILTGTHFHRLGRVWQIEINVWPMGVSLWPMTYPLDHDI